MALYAVPGPRAPRLAGMAGSAATGLEPGVFCATAAITRASEQGATRIGNFMALGLEEMSPYKRAPSSKRSLARREARVISAVPREAADRCDHLLLHLQQKVVGSGFEFLAPRRFADWAVDELSYGERAFACLLDRPQHHLTDLEAASSLPSESSLELSSWRAPAAAGQEHHRPISLN